MSDVSPGVRGTDPAYRVDVAATPPGQSSGGGAGDRAKQVAGQTKDAAADVKDTAREQVQRVGEEAKTQARNLASEVRDTVGRQARTQNERLSGTIRQTADQLDEMRRDRPDSPATSVVSRVADGGRQLADYLDRNGPEGVLREVQNFARRRPGAFLATALAAGFVVGRLGKSVAKADPNAGTDKPRSDSYVSGVEPVRTESVRTESVPTYPAAGYPETTGQSTTSEYAATGTGTPVVVEPPERF
jgi:hypothetical protein